jgi:hypothetical protein
MWNKRKKILRRPTDANYPSAGVCQLCGTYAAEDSKTTIEEHVIYTLDTCGVCKRFTDVAHPRDFGWPTFYTYENGTPVYGTPAE